jgi:hypothetical protein
MKTHQQMQEATLMGNPLVALQTRDENGGRNAWRTDRVFIDDDEAEAFLAPQRHRYPEADKDVNWKLYAIPAAGSLATIVKEARDEAEAAANFEADTEGMEVEVATPVAVIGSGGRVAVPAEGQQPDPFDRQPEGTPKAPEFSADDRGNVVDFYDAEGEPVGKIDREAEVDGVPDRKTFEAFHSAEALEAWMRANGYGEELDEIRAGYPKAEPTEGTEAAPQG